MISVAKRPALKLPRVLHAQRSAPCVEALAAWIPRVTRLEAWRQPGTTWYLVPRQVHLKFTTRSVRGWAYSDGKVVVYCGTRPEDEAWNLAILVHEFAHVATPREHHGPKFRETLAMAIRELTGDLIPTARVGAKWDRDALAAAALRAMMDRVAPKEIRLA